MSAKRNQESLKPRSRAEFHRQPTTASGAKYNLAIQHYNSGQRRKAEEYCLQIIAANPKHAESLHLLGVIEYQSGRHLAAAERIQTAIRVNAHNPSYYLNLGCILKDIGRLEEAVTSFESALALSPNQAEAHNNLGTALEALGRVEEARSSYSRALDLRPNYAEAHNNLGNALQRLRRLDEAIESYGRALTQKPHYPDALSNLGSALRERGRLDEAFACCLQAAEHAPNNAEIHDNLGNTLLALGKPEDAEVQFRRALALGPARAQVLNNLGNALQFQGRFEEAVACYSDALTAKPRYAEVFNNLGGSLRALGYLEEALTCFDRALACDPEYAEAHWNRSLTQLLCGDYAQGWQGYEWRWKRRDRLAVRLDFAEPQWRGEALEGRRILLHAEQGLGDSLQFLRYVPLVQIRGGRVILEVPSTLRRIAALLPGIADLIIAGDARPHFDLHCPLMSLPLAFETGLESIPDAMPYLSIPTEAREKASAFAWPASGLRVGVVWAGNPNHPKDRFRSISFSALGPLLSTQNVNFFSLQLGRDAEFAERNANIVDLGAVIGDLADAAACVEQLDLVIAVDTSVAHLAGALGKPVWLLLPKDPDWRWLVGREDSPWYPTARLFRQAGVGNWSEVIARVAAELRNAVAGSQFKPHKIVVDAPVEAIPSLQA